MPRPLPSAAALAAAVLGATTFASGQDPAEPAKWYWGGFTGRSQLILGSEEDRRGNGLTIGYARPAPRLRLMNVPGQLALELYYGVSDGDRVGRRPGPVTQSWGVLALARWRWRSGAHFPMYGDLGIGIQHVSRTSPDLDSKINSTPTFGLGFRLIKGRELALIGVRYLHISNAGLRGDNQGQNQVFLTVFIPM